MAAIKKAYGYITRIKEGRPQVLVFQHPIKEAGIQIPKGTVEAEEDPYYAVIREIREETGLMNFNVEQLIIQDRWKCDDGAIHERYFYKITIHETRDGWTYNPTGGGAESGLTFRFFWVSMLGEVELVRGHGDYLHEILDQ
ncbi:NUDIX hydrolase [Peribacillus butanolivorans]|uniref:NUDIX hydrolase n=1 Tax=Peribacillus butanolivorans TaxID=421767 RepID=UPI00368F3EE8